MNKILIVHIPQETASASAPKHDLRHPEALRRLEREAHHAVGDDAADRRGRGGVELLDEAAEGVQAGGGDGDAERGEVLRGVGVGGREAVGDGLEAEPREAGHGGGAVGADEAAVVVVGVDEGDEEAAAVEELG